MYNISKGIFKNGLVKFYKSTKTTQDFIDFLNDYNLFMENTPFNLSEIKEIIEETLQNKEQEIVKKEKFCLFVSINTDDDAEIIYNKESFCFYNQDFRIMKYFNTVEECREHLKKIEIIEHKKGMKDFIQSILDKVIKNKSMGIDHSSNQEIEIYITKTKR